MRYWGASRPRGSAGVWPTRREGRREGGREGRKGRSRKEGVWLGVMTLGPCNILHFTDAMETALLHDQRRFVLDEL